MASKRNDTENEIASLARQSWDEEWQKVSNAYRVLSMNSQQEYEQSQLLVRINDEQYPNLEEAKENLEKEFVEAPHAVDEGRYLHVLLEGGGPSSGYDIFFRKQLNGEWSVVGGYYFYSYNSKTHRFDLAIPDLEKVVDVYKVGIYE